MISYDPAFENIAGKGESAGNMHFVLFPEKFTAEGQVLAFVAITLQFRLTLYQTTKFWT